MKSPFKKIAILMLRLVVCGPLWAAPKDLSNILPVKMVQSLMQSGVWSESFEDSSSAEGQELLTFWQSLQAQKDPSTISAQIFAGSANGASFHSLPALYPIKISILRYVKDSAPSAYTTQLEARVIKTYVEMVVTLIKLANVTEMNPIIDNVRGILAKGSIQLLDLSPGQRRRLSTAVASSAHQNHTWIERQDNGKYLVNGLYIPGQKILAADLLRSPSETVVTLAHEFVHLADPSLTAAQAQLESLFPEVQNRLREALGNRDGMDEMARALAVDVFNEMGKKDASSAISKIRDMRTDQLKAQIARGDYKELAEDPVIRQWTQALLKTTLENEVRAYLFSIAVYSRLQAQFNIIPPSNERRGFLEQITQGSFDFAQSLSSAMNPFNKSSSAFAKIPRGLSPAQMQDLQLKANYVKSALELQYLTETKALLSSLNSRYASVIQIMKQVPPRNSGSVSLPEWTQPGKFESATNPYVILTAKLSTAWVMRFKTSIQGVIADLKDINSSLIVLNAGVLDLHNLTFGELKLLGLHAANADASVLPDELSSTYKKDIMDLPATFQAYLQKTQWTPTAPTGTVIEQKALTQTLIRLRLLKALYWLDQSFPIAKENMTSTKVLMTKLHEGFYDQEDISPERARQLEDELVDALKTAAGSGSQMREMDFLLGELSIIYQVAQSEKWSSVTTEVNQKMRNASMLLANLGIESPFSAAKFSQQLETQISGFKDQLAAAYKDCAKIDAMQFFPGGPRFNIGDLNFPLTAICYQKKLYGFRQPGDYTRAATTMVKNGVPESRIFIGAKPMRLTPIIEITGGMFGGAGWKK
jgi:hypothetical protein